MDSAVLGLATLGCVLVRCAFFDRNFHSRMPLRFTPLLRLKRCHACNHVAVHLGRSLLLHVRIVNCVQTRKGWINWFFALPANGCSRRRIYCCVRQRTSCRSGCMPRCMQHTVSTCSNRPSSSNASNSNECTVRVFRQKFTLEDAIGSHACSLEASRRATNGMHLGCSLLLPVDTVNWVQRH
jgi:hypothetical protein